jgi:tetratricopeptide (TPR) repeat protein
LVTVKGPGVEADKADKGRLVGPMAYASGSGYQSMALSPDGRRVAAGGWMRGTIQIWDATPLTPEARAQREAIALLEFLFAKPLIQEDVVKSVRANRTINDEVRKRALALARRWQADPELLKSACWAVVRQPGAAASRYEQALGWAEEACRIRPREPAYQTMKGMAQYRAGKYKQALATLSQPQQMRRAFNDYYPYINRAFRIMARYQLGQKKEAVESYHQEMEVMVPFNKDLQAFKHEVEELLQGNPKGPKK